MTRYRVGTNIQPPAVEAEDEDIELEKSSTCWPRPSALMVRLGRFPAYFYAENHEILEISRYEVARETDS